MEAVTTRDRKLDGKLLTADARRKQRLRTWLDAARCRLSSSDYSAFQLLLRKLKELGASADGQRRPRSLQDMATLLWHAEFPEGHREHSAWVGRFKDALCPPLHRDWSEVVRATAPAPMSPPGIPSESLQEPSHEACVDTGAHVQTAGTVQHDAARVERPWLLERSAALLRARPAGASASLAILAPAADSDKQPDASPPVCAARSAELQVDACTGTAKHGMEDMERTDASQIPSPAVTVACSAAGASDCSVRLLSMPREATAADRDVDLEEIESQSSGSVLSPDDCLADDAVACEKQPSIDTGRHKRRVADIENVPCDTAHEAPPSKRLAHSEQEAAGAPPPQDAPVIQVRSSTTENMERAQALLGQHVEDSVSAELAKPPQPLCVMCHSPPVKPKVASLCGHFGCTDCWRSWMVCRFECPVCRKKVRPNNLIRIQGWGDS
eukprot:gnl/TRDRNA2_/TRDRNA2_184051_c0_seq1.p1 gnl/TRDRNA2_/TRDRNA2_184051_c0~~gnl/TRDRNA2_/TRDRNA2_184051_c0_seq1.p1  ORF type:complete len:441 (+),score=56.85 gnl/TRDRNA2_/TRDRNA2_184051_c0_seq1:69-1391(+)